MKVYDIPLRLPGINEYQAACRRHPLAGARMKRDAVQQVMTYLVPMVKLAWPIQAEIYYTEPNKKRDVDNVCGFGAKVILDALVKAGFIPDDSPTYINRIDQRVEYSDAPSITVVIKERKDETYTDLDDIDQCFAAAMEIMNGVEEEEETPEEPPKIAPKRTKRRKTDNRSAQIEMPL